jgi:DNA-binding SARP family transcriptional activator
MDDSVVDSVFEVDQVSAEILMESPTLHIRLLGAVDLRYGDDPLPPLDSARAESLLAYLLLHGDAPQPRQRLAFMLWPDSTDTQARTNLRHLLHTLRHALTDPELFLDVTPRTLQWRPESPVKLDVACFLDAISRAGTARDDGLSALTEAVELYSGDLLDGCYEEWILAERERLRTLHEARGDYAEAIRYADLLLRQDILREETYRLLMRLYDAHGDRARALHVYHVCASTLERELGVEPADATREVYEALLPLDREAVDADLQGERLAGAPLIGRGQEWLSLTNLWRTAEGGRAQFVIVTGEAGVGKTRLIEEFCSWCVRRGAVAAEARSYQAEGALAYGPVVAWLRTEAIKNRLARLDHASLTELSRLLPEILNELPDLTRPEPLPGDEQRQRLFDAVVRAIRAVGAPMILVADDLHWCDRETFQVIHYLLRSELSSRLLVAATARREEIDHHHPLSELLAGLHALECCVEIQLERFSQAETGVLAERITGRAIDESDVDLLFRETEGSPLFVVEAIRAGWKRGSPERAWMTSRVQAAIQTRLDNLSDPARELVGIAATIGREFTTDVLTSASEADPDMLVRGLDELWRRRLVREQAAEAYDFSHVKIREVAYLGLTPARRRRAHLSVARALERSNARDLESVSGELAAHYERAGMTERAIDWYMRAAATARELHANAEVVRLLDRALDLLHMLPATPEFQARELEILSLLPTALGFVEGFASDRLVRTLQRALDLCNALDVEPASPLIRSLAISSLSQRDFAAARECGERLRARGEHEADDMLIVEADYVVGISAFWQGELAAARTHFEAVVDRYRSDHSRAHFLQYGLDSRVVCLSRLGNTLWFLGFPESAIRARDSAIAAADEIGHPYSRATAIVFAAVLAVDMRDVENVRSYASMLTTRRPENETRTIQNVAETMAGYVDVLDGRQRDGIARIQKAIEEVRESDHAPGQHATSVRVLLEACSEAGDAQLGLATADRALSSAESSRLWEAEIRRLRADFLAALDAPAEEVFAELERALDVARRQGAKMFELRTAMQLLRYQRFRGNGLATSQVRELLARIVQQLPEQQDNNDAREAAALLVQS